MGILDLLPKELTGNLGGMLQQPTAKTLLTVAKHGLPYLERFLNGKEQQEKMADTYNRWHSLDTQEAHNFYIDVAEACEAFENDFDFSSRRGVFRHAKNVNQHLPCMLLVATPSFKKSEEDIVSTPAIADDFGLESMAELSSDQQSLSPEIPLCVDICNRLSSGLPSDLSNKIQRELGGEPTLEEMKKNRPLQSTLAGKFRLAMHTGMIEQVSVFVYIVVPTQYIDVPAALLD